MIALYSLSAATRIFMAMFCFLAMIFETIVVILIAQQKNKNWFQLLYEASLLVFFFASAFLFALVQKEINDGLFCSNMDWMRYISLFVIFFSIILFAKHPNFQIGLPIPFLFLSLPWFDSLLGNICPFLLIFLNLFFFFRSIQKLSIFWNNVHQNLSALSIKQALDSIPDGLLFANKRGHVLLCNNAMHSLLQFFHISPSLRPQEIYHQIKAIGTTEYLQCISTEDSLLLRILNSKTYLISLSHFQYKSHKYMQLFAADVTEEDLLTKELDEYTAKLVHDQKSILAALANIEEIEHSKELLRLKSIVHDIIGQRLSVVHQILENIDHAPISTRQLKELLLPLKNDLDRASFSNASETLEEIQKLFSCINVSIILSGDLPTNQKQKSILLQIIREASTNAVHHGNAKHIYINSSLHEKEWQMTISNDGSIPKNTIRESNGLQGIREKLRQINGSFSYQLFPFFCLQICFPFALS